MKALGPDLGPIYNTPGLLARLSALEKINEASETYQRLHKNAIRGAGQSFDLRKINLELKNVLKAS